MQSIKNKLKNYKWITKIYNAYKNKNLKKIFVSKILGKQIVHFLHIGKTGGSSIKFALRNNNLTNGYYIILHRHNFKLKDFPTDVIYSSI